MKLLNRLLLAAAFVSLAGGVSAQSIADRFIEAYSAAEEQLQNREYKAAVKGYDAVERMIASATPEQKDSLTGRFGCDAEELIDGMSYNYACALALTGSKRKALDRYERFVDGTVGKSEYYNYEWAAEEDSDLDCIRSDKRFKAAAARLKEWCDYRHILQQAAPYCRQQCDTLPRWRYAAPNDRELVRVREYFKLDSIAGAGDEQSKIKNILRWVHDNIPHDGSSSWPEERNSIAMYELCKREGRGINCRMLAQVLNECYLSMGLKSRYVTCLPRTMVSDCHVINVVYSNQLDKWVWVDPTFNAFLTDDRGEMMSIEEVRECIRQGRKCHLNEDANWNNRSVQTYEDYIEHYMAKNLYRLQCRSVSEWAAESSEKQAQPWRVVTLVPSDTYSSCKPDGYNAYTADAEWFWQSPYDLP